MEKIKDMPLGDRMKAYERDCNRMFSTEDPIVVRVDGRGFSNWTSNLDKPVDVDFAEIMRDTARRVMDEIQCCVLAYTESDEITFVIHKNNPKANVFFGGNQSKLNSIIASMTTAYFNANVLDKYVKSKDDKWIKPLAFFDCRSFEVPKEDTSNAVYFRIRDARRNSILNAGRAFHSHKEIMNKKTDEILESFEDTRNCWESLSDNDRFGTLFYYESNGDSDERRMVIEGVKDPRNLQHGEMYGYLYQKIFKEEPPKDE